MPEPNDYDASQSYGCSCFMTLIPGLSLIIQDAITTARTLFELRREIALESSLPESGSFEMVEIHRNLWPLICHFAKRHSS